MITVNYNYGNGKVSSALSEARTAAKTVPWLKDNRQLLMELDGR